MWNIQECQLSKCLNGLMILICITSSVIILFLLASIFLVNLLALGGISSKF